jgi:hypothetical protein
MPSRRPTMPEWRALIQQRLNGLQIEPTDEMAIVEELAQHVEDRYSDLVGAGLSDQEAFVRSLEELGGEDLQDELMDALKRK